MLFEVNANCYGLVVQFEIEAANKKEALEKAEKEAAQVFSFIGIKKKPTIKVRLKESK